MKVGSVQITSAFQRAEFYNSLKSKKYSTKLVAAGAPIIVDINAPSSAKTVGGVCNGNAHRIGEIDINAYDSIVHNLANTYANPTQVPVILSYNTFETSGGGCCILGYHDAYSRSGGCKPMPSARTTTPASSEARRSRTSMRGRTSWANSSTIRSSITVPRRGATSVRSAAARIIWKSAIR